MPQHSGPCAYDGKVHGRIIIGICSACDEAETRAIMKNDLTHPHQKHADEVAEIEKRHEQAEADIQNNFGAAYSSRITQCSYSIHQDRATLLRLLKSRQPPVLSEDERAFVGEMRHAAFDSNERMLLAIIDRLVPSRHTGR